VHIRIFKNNVDPKRSVSTKTLDPKDNLLNYWLKMEIWKVIFFYPDLLIIVPVVLVIEVGVVVEICEAGTVLLLITGLAIKNPPKKKQKTHLKKPTKNVFFLWVLWFFFNF
jgi:hypothetical protein